MMITISRYFFTSFRPISSFNCSETELRQSIALGLEFSKNAGDLFSAIANYSADANRTLSRQKMTVEEVLQKKLKGHKEHLIELKKSYGNVCCAPALIIRLA